MAVQVVGGLRGVVRRLGSSATVRVVGGLTLILAVPLIVALVVAFREGWYPVWDIALLEMRVRDVIEGPVPLLGPHGRFEGHGEAGAHPGPLVFYLLAPIYWLGGKTGNALLVGTVALNLTGVALALGLAVRRGGLHLAFLVTGTLLIMFRAFSATWLIVPWSPWLVLVWWLVFLLAVWSILCRDLAILPVAVVVGSLCVQTHAGYLLLVGGLLAGAVGWPVLVAVKHARQEGAAPEWWSTRPLAIAIGLGLVVWIPPLLEQFAEGTGNASILTESFRDPSEERVAFGSAFESWLAHLNPLSLLGDETGELTPDGPAVVSVAFVALWAGAAILAWRREDREVVRLHAVVGAAAALGLVATAGIYGTLWPYLVLWGWVTAALMTASVVWTAWSARDLLLQWLPDQGATLGRLLVALAVLAVTVDAADTEVPHAEVSEMVGDTVTATVGYLVDNDPADCGEDCRYRVTWTDPRYFDAPVWGFISGLERYRIDAGPGPQAASAANMVRDHRVVPDEQVDATLHVAVGERAIQKAVDYPGNVEIASANVYSSEEQRDNERLRAEVAEELRAEGYHDEAETVDDGESLIPMDDGMSDLLQNLVSQVNALELPMAVFLVPTYP